MHKLSDIKGERRPDTCQGCGTKERLQLWQEADECDRPTMVFIILCGVCSNRLIEQHTRLYRQADRSVPVPGLMPICVDCVLRVGLDCTHEMTKAGKGLKFTGGERMGFWDGHSGGKRHGGMIFRPVTACEGKR